VKSLLRRTAFAAAAAGAAAALTAAGLAGASVSQPTGFDGCETGIYTGYCGTQVDQGSPALSIAVDVRGERTKVIATSDPRGGSADWFWFRYNGGANNIAEFAPHGVASNFVMAQVGDDIVLQKATGELNQQWHFTCDAVCNFPYTGTWTNLATGDIIASTSDGGPVIPVPAPSGTPTTSERWTFVTPS
jgi:hypothetical protein